MGKKENVIMVLLTLFLDGLLCLGWYISLYPSEPVPAANSVLTGAFLMICTAAALFMNYIIYDTSIAEES